MPQIAPGQWKLGLPFYWVRKYKDGSVEYEFDPVDGHPTLWGTPTDLVEITWEPMTPELAEKIRPYNEFGVPVSAPAISIIVHDGESPIIYRDGEIVNGLRVGCKSCKTVFNVRGMPKTCPKCGAEAEWGSFKTVPISWDESVYGIGIEGRYEIRFGADRICVE